MRTKKIKRKGDISELIFYCCIIALPVLQVLIFYFYVNFNSITMSFKQYDTLQEKGLAHFDCWASTFGETSTAIELAPEGPGYRARTRFAKFFNLPELMAMFKEVADIKTSDQLHLPVPEVKQETVVVKPLP